MFAGKGVERLTNNRPPQYYGYLFTYGYKDVADSDADLCPDWGRMRRLFHFAIKVRHVALVIKRRAIQ